MTYTWMLEELKNAGRENLDAGHVSSYDRKEDAHALQEVAYLMELGLDHNTTLVDMGTGTGQLALAAAPHCRRVVAVDVSPVMLARFNAKLEGAELTNVECVQSGFLSYHHQGEPADIVYSRYALHHLPDFWKVLALQRIHRTLRVGGLFRLWDIVYNFSALETETRLEAWCATLDNDAEEGWTRADIEEHIRDEHSTFTWLLEPMLERCGFRIEAAEYSEDGIFARYVARTM